MLTSCDVAEPWKKGSPVFFWKSNKVFWFWKKDPTVSIFALDFPLKIQF